jgi:hAT family C-terminal dimerisation region
MLTIFFWFFFPQILHDLVLVFSPFVDVLLGEEGEFYITSSSAVPRLYEVYNGIQEFFTDANRGRRREGVEKLLAPRAVASWKNLFEQLWRRYVSAFQHDEIFLAATTLDLRFGLKTLPTEVQDRAFKSTKELLEKEWMRQENDRLAAVQVEVQPGLVRADGPQVAAQRNAGVRIEVDFNPQALLARNGIQPPAAAAIARNFRQASDELQDLFSNDIFLHTLPMDANPLEVFTRAGAPNMILCFNVALDVLAVPAGEAPSERIFSIAGRVQTFSRIRIAPVRLCEETWLKKNKFLWVDDFELGLKR